MKILLKLFIAIFLFSLSCLAQVTNQTKIAQPCALTLKDAPRLRELKLGMSLDEVSKTLGTTIELESAMTILFLKKDGDKYIDAQPERNYLKEINIGEKRFYFLKKKSNSNNFPRYNPNSEDSTKVEEAKISSSFEGLKKMALTFFKGTLYDISIQYDSDTYKWANIQEFIVTISEKLNLPKDAWWTADKIANLPSNTKQSINFASLDCKDFKLRASIRPEYAQLDLTDVFTEIEIKTEAKRAIIEREQEKLKDFKP